MMTVKFAACARRAVALALFASLVACDDDPIRPGPDAETREHAVVLNSVGRTLTTFAVEAPDSTRTIALGPEGTPSSIAAREGWALVPLGVTPAVAVIDLEHGVVDDVIPLPAGSGATGAVIVDDSLAFVANPELGTVTPVLYRAGTTGADIEVGVYPTALVAHAGRVYVLEANLVDFAVQGTSSVSVIDASTLDVVDGFALGGRNAGDALVVDGVLYVLNRGDFGDDNGSISVVSLAAGAETDLIVVGAGTGTLAALDGDLLVSSYVNGLFGVDPQSGAFVVGPEDGVTPDGATNLLAVRTDSDGRIYAVAAGDCSAPGAVHVWEGTLSDVAAAQPVTVGSCPIDVVFTTF